MWLPTVDFESTASAVSPPRHFREIAATPSFSGGERGGQPRRCGGQPETRDARFRTHRDDQRGTELRAGRATFDPWGHQHKYYGNDDLHLRCPFPAAHALELCFQPESLARHSELHLRRRRSGHHQGWNPRQRQPAAGFATGRNVREHQPDSDLNQRDVTLCRCQRGDHTDPATALTYKYTSRDEIWKAGRDQYTYDVSGRRET